MLTSRWYPYLPSNVSYSWNSKLGSSINKTSSGSRPRLLYWQTLNWVFLPPRVAHFTHMAAGSHAFSLTWCHHFGCGNWANVDRWCSRSQHVACFEDWWLDYALERRETEAGKPSGWGGPGTLHSRECSLTTRLLCKKWVEPSLQAALVLVLFSRALLSEEPLVLKNFHCVFCVKTMEGWSSFLPPHLTGTISQDHRIILVGRDF